MAHQRNKPESLLASPSYQYGSIPFRKDELDHGARIPSSSSCRRSSRKSLRWGLGALLGVTFVVVGTIVVRSPERSANNLNGVYDNYGYQVEPATWRETIRIPLLGQSASAKTQQVANRNRGALYGKAKEDPRKEKHDNEHPTTKDVEAPDGCEATVMLIRHCEKGNIREHCDYLGYERSAYLASLFGDDPDTRWPAPSYLIAEKPGARRNPEKRNFRETETLLPLATKFNLTIDNSSFSTLDTKELAEHVQGMLRSGELCGKLVVVAWMHSKLPKIAHALGCGPQDGCPLHYRGSEFDVLFQLKFVYRKLLHSTHKNLKAPKDKQWMIYGSVQKEDFDPLAFSKQVGDYPKGGTKSGGRWRPLDGEIPERDSVHSLVDDVSSVAGSKL